MQRSDDFIGAAFEDQDGVAIVSPTIVDGEICVAAAATDSPTPIPAAEALPQTGGASGASSANSMAWWLLAAAGLSVVAGGA